MSPGGRRYREDDIGFPQLEKWYTIAKREYAKEKKAMEKKGGKMTEDFKTVSEYLDLIEYYLGFPDDKHIHDQKHMGVRYDWINRTTDEGEPWADHHLGPQRAKKGKGNTPRRVVLSRKKK